MRRNFISASTIFINIANLKKKKNCFFRKNNIFSPLFQILKILHLILVFCLIAISEKEAAETLILSIDLGTSSSRIAIVNTKLQVVDIEKMEHDQIHVEAGWTEHDPMQLFFNVNLMLDRLYHHKKEVNSICLNSI